MKYPNMEWGTMEAVVNKLGGEEGVKNFLSDLSRAVPSSIISINRHIGYRDGFLPTGLWTTDERDERSKRLTVIDLHQIRLIPRPINGWPNLTGEEKLDLLKQSDEIRLDARILEVALWNTRVIPKEWKNKDIYFDGDVFLSAGSHTRTVLYLRGDERGWHYRPEALKYIRDLEGWSAVL
jgi:hypothetical protein